MSPFHLVDAWMGIDDAIKVDVRSLSNIVRVEGSSQDYLGFRGICNTVSNYSRLIVGHPGCVPWKFLLISGAEARAIRSNPIKVSQSKIWRRNLLKRKNS